MISKKATVVAIVVCAATVLVLASCSAGNDSSAGSSESGASKSPAVSSQANVYHKIDAEEGKRMMDAGNVVVIDVRTPSEYAEGHIPDAVNIPNEDIGAQQPSGLDDFDEVLIVYCRTGVRSKQASDKLVELGYQNVYDMGGIVDWPYDTVSGDGDA